MDMDVRMKSRSFEPLMVVNNEEKRIGLADTG